MIKVLIVDDEPFIRQGLKILINWEQYGYEISGEASNGYDAVELMKQTKFDLVITDIKMPQMDGLKLIEYTREHISKEIRYIILSGFYEFEYAQKAIRYDVADYILKPVQKEELIRVLEDYKEQYYNQIENRKKMEFSEKNIFDRHLSFLISGKQIEEGIGYISNYLVDTEQLRYISIEYDALADKFRGLSDEEKQKELNLLYDALKNYLGEHWYHAFMGTGRQEDEYAVGFLYAKKLTELAGVTEKTYISELYEAVASKLTHRIIILIGQKVDHISEISDSYNSAAIARSFQRFSNGQEIAYYDEVKPISPNKNPVNKEMMDDLIRSIEENDPDEINRKIELIYEHFKDMVMEPGIIKMNLDYLIFSLISLAKDLDPDYEQEEVYRLISQGGYEQFEVRGSVKHFKEFALEFSNYLSQVRQHAFGGVLAEVEKEIIEHYMDNLSLKSLSEKYYINSAYLGQIFKKQYGISFKDYLNNYRIDRATELLIRSDEKIYLIANAVGFNNTDYFISKFVQLKGTTPLQYRKQRMNRK